MAPPFPLESPPPAPGEDPPPPDELDELAPVEQATIPMAHRPMPTRIDPFPARRDLVIKRSMRGVLIQGQEPSKSVATRRDVVPQCAHPSLQGSHQQNCCIESDDADLS
jgi:hypothetical protein